MQIRKVDVLKKHLPNCHTLIDYPMPDKESLANMTAKGLIVVGNASNCHIVLDEDDH